MYSLDLRKLASHIYGLFFSLRKTAAILKVSHTSVSRWLKTLNIKPYKRKSPLSTEHVICTIKSALVADPFLSTRKLVSLVHDVCNILVSKELIRTAINKFGFSRKKAKFFSVPKQLEEQTKGFKETRNRLLNEGRQVYSLDETSFGRNCKDMKGYSPKGQVLAIKRNQPRITTTSSLVIVSDCEIVSHQEVQGSFNTERFCTFLESLSLPAGSVILLDNVRFHHSILAREIVERKAWYFLFTPPYSPWFNPIEGVFSIIKRDFYKHQDIVKAFGTVNSSHCKAFFHKSLIN